MNQQVSWGLNTAEETKQLGERLAKVLFPGDILALEGDLGVGKTTFAQGLARGLGIEETIDSPTFTIVKEYQGKFPLYHLDVYRLDSPNEALGLEEYLHNDGICLIEWASNIADWLPTETLWLYWHICDDGSRQLTLKYKG